jgi:PKD repeat protein
MKKFLILILLFNFLNYLFSQSDDKSNCEVIFQYSIQDNQLSSFSHKVINGTDRIVSYYWDFGDGYTSNLANPHHVFLSEGSYITCLTVVFENNCVATYCDTIVVNNPLLDPEQNYGISGYVFAGNALLPEGVVLLFRKINNQYRAISYTKVYNGFYSFNNLMPSQYWLYAIPYFNVNTLFYPNYFPTYYGNKLLWQDAVSINVTGMHNNKNIQLLSSYEMFIGNDSLCGKVFISDSAFFEYNVYLNNWFSSEMPPQNNLNLAPNQVILLADNNNKVQRFALTSHYGEFVFKRIPNQILKIRPEKFGISSQTFTIDLSQQNDVEFYINSSSFIINVNEVETNNLFKINVFPNPTNYSFIYVDILASDKPSNAEISLLDIYGRVIINQNFLHSNKETYIIPLHNCAPGTYIVSVRINNKIQKKIFVKN